MKRFAIAGLVLAAALACMGCSSTGEVKQQVGMTVLVDAAVAYAVQRGADGNAVEWQRRAEQIASVALQLKSLDEGTVATLPTLMAALDPLVSRLSPGAQLTARGLTTALAGFIASNTGNMSTEKATIQFVLAEVLNATSVYIPRNPRVPVAPSG